MDPVIDTEGLKDEIVNDLRDIGTCDLCILRYLGVKEPYIYRENDSVQKILRPKSGGMSEVPTTEVAVKVAEDSVEENGDGPSKAKILKISPCIACLGLLQDCVQEPCLNQIAEDIKAAGIEASSYALMLTLPVSIQIRAYSVWIHLVDKFPQVYKSLGYMKPEGTTLKNVWKWICVGNLKQRVSPSSEWIATGSLVVNMFLEYPDDDQECQQLFSMQKRGKRWSELTRGGAESTLSGISYDTFRERFGSPPTLPKSSLRLEKVSCSHMAVFLAGRYCKYSRNVSQSPWLNADGSRVRGEGSVQEFIQAEVLPLFKSDQVKFSASGREDSDVRMLGKGRPFVIEIMNPKRTIFTAARMKELRKKINESTDLISVRDLQMVQKKDLSNIMEGQETKTKTYCALCHTVGKEVTTEMLQILNNTPMPLVLQQKTPIRVLHRRSLATRPRSILEIHAEPAKKSKEMFILRVKTEAGTYVKEFVHGDFGRTQPSVIDLLGCDTQILALDVEAVELNWPPEIKDQ